MFHVTKYLNIMKRGALIVIEGVDRTGKTTQSKTLVENLRKKHIQVEYTNFPARDTEIGKIINSYLTSKNDLSDEVIHLLFSANRWEMAQGIIKKLESGVTLVVDRYCYSGVAFSASKGLDVNWCKAPDVGLPQPDKVFYLTMPFDEILQRNGFGKERYEILDFQKKVSEAYSKLKDDSWDILNANRSVEEIQDELLEKSLDVVNSSTTKPIGKLWVDSK